MLFTQASRAPCRQRAPVRRMMPALRCERAAPGANLKENPRGGCLIVFAVGTSNRLNGTGSSLLVLKPWTTRPNNFKVFPRDENVKNP